MSGNSFDFDLELFIRQMGDTSDEMKREVGALVQPTADAMLATLSARYPVGANHRNRKTVDGRVIDVPHMREDGYVRTLPSQHHLLPVRRVVGPRLAYIWQNGTIPRETRKGWKRGVSPRHDKGFFERTAAQVRADMMRQAQSILDRDRTIG